MTLFEDMQRIDGLPPTHNDGSFSYLSRSDRPEAHRVRGLIEEWLDHYPADKRDALVSRLRLANDDAHLSAYFELLLHEWMLRRGFVILAIEPPLPSKTTSPDFLVETGNGDRFYLEAVTATGRSKNETGARKRLNDALATIDSVSSPHHFLDVHHRGSPQRPLTHRRLRHELTQWIASLPEGDLAKEAPQLLYEEHGLKIRIRAWPRQKPSANGRAIGARFPGATWARTLPGLKESIEFKAKHYGDLDHPLVVAVNILDHFFYDTNMLDVLMGTATTESFTGPDGSWIHRDRRKPDGVWVTPRGSSKTGLSAVLSLMSVDPWNFAGRKPVLIRNPAAIRPLPPIDLGCDEIVDQDGAYHRDEGLTLGEMCGLVAGWPESASD